jgi:hypothetical protein
VSSVGRLRDIDAAYYSKIRAARATPDQRALLALGREGSGSRTVSLDRQNGNVFARATQIWLGYMLQNVLLKRAPVATRA